MSDPIRVGDRVRILLEAGTWKTPGSYEGTVIRIDPYSSHRQFYWVELDLEVVDPSGKRTNLISVFNPKKIARIGKEPLA